MTRSTDRITFRAYKDGKHVLTTWATRGTMAEQLERSVYQARLDRGELSYVDVEEPAVKTTTMLRKTP